MNFKALELTSIVMKIPRGLRPGNLRKAWEKQEVQKKWDSTTWAQKIANKKKVGYTFVLHFDIDMYRYNGFTCKYYCREHKMRIFSSYKHVNK